MSRPASPSPRPFGRGLALTLMLGCGGATATGSFSATATTSATVTTSSSSSSGSGTIAPPPPPSAPLTFTIDARDTLPAAADDDRTGARPALVSQQPFSASIAAMAVSGDGRFVLAVDERGAIALVDAASGEIRGARAIPRAATQSVRCELDARATRGLIVLASTTAQFATEVYTWDLVTDALERRVLDTDGAYAPDLVALSPLGDAVLLVERSRHANDAPGRLVRLDAQSGETRTLPGTARRNARIGFTRGLGRPFAIVADGTPRLHLVGDDDVETEIRAADDASIGRRIAFRPGGGQIATVTADSALAICSPVDGGCPSTVPWPGHRVVEVSYGVGGGCIRLADDAGNQAFVEADSGQFVTTLVHADPARIVLGRCDEIVVPRAGGTFDRINLRQPAPTATVGADAASAVGLEANETPSLTAASEDGRVIAVAYDGVLMLATGAELAMRGVDLVGVPGVVTDVLWTPSGDELVVRRSGEILRVTSDRVQSTPCSGEGGGVMLHDGSVLFDPDHCAIRSTQVAFQVDGEVLASVSGATTSLIVRESTGDVVRVDGQGNRTVLWAMQRSGCRPGPNCIGHAFLSRDGLLAVVRIGRGVRAFEIPSGRTMVAFETDPGDPVAITSDRRNVLVAHRPAGGLESYDVARGGLHTLVPTGTVIFEADIEVDRYVVLDNPAAQPRFVDAASGRPVNIATSSPDGLQVGRAVALHDDLFLVGTVPHQLVDAGRGRMIRTEGVVLDAVRNGSDVVAAICVADVLQVMRFGAGDPQRVGSLGGCNRMGKVAIRPDGGAVAVAIADAALVLQLGGNQPPIAIRTQLDARGYYMPIVASLAGGFDTSDEAADVLRIRRAGPLNRAVLEPARGSLQRQSNPQASVFARRGGRR